jgi:2-polyprenyl-6-methoxyphenol hydroxylase-like FAD-dependent oxidoreductase
VDRVDVLIVGGGFTGSALACALADGNRRVHVLEARRSPGTRFAGELLHPTGVDQLERLGLLEPLLDAGAVKVSGFAVFPRPGRGETLLPYSAVPGGRPFGLGIEHHQMVGVLRTEASARPGVTVETGARVVDLVREGGRVVGARLESGAERRSALVLCADGRHSKLRRADARLLSFTAALRVRTTLPHPGWGHIFLGAWGPILAYPIADGVARLCFDLPVGTTRATVLDRLRAAYTPVLPAGLRAAVEHALDDEPVELVANHAMRARTLAAPGLALVGDAGGCAHPLTAAGMTICLNDVRLVSDALDGGEELSGYAERRAAFARSRAWLTRSLYRVFRAPDPASRALREGVFRYWRDPRRRAASTALLTGADPTLGGLVRELSRVVLSAVRA